MGILIEGNTDYKVYTIRKKICCFKFEEDVIKAYCAEEEKIEKKGYEVAQRLDSIKEFIEPFL